MTATISATAKKLVTEIATSRFNCCCASAWNSPAHPARRHDVDVLHPFELLAGDPVAHLRMIGPHHAGQPLVHHMLDDEIAGRIDDAAEHQRRRAGDDARFHQIVARGRGAA